MGLPFAIHDQHSNSNSNSNSNSSHVICSNKAVESMFHGKENLEKKPISKKLCICSDTTHAGSFKCRLHRSNIEIKDQITHPRTVN